MDKRFEDFAWIIRNITNYGNSVVPTPLVKTLGIGVTQGILQGITEKDVWLRKVKTVSAYSLRGNVKEEVTYIAETPEARERRMWTQ